MIAICTQRLLVRRDAGGARFELRIMYWAYLLVVSLFMDSGVRPLANSRGRIGVGLAARARATVMNHRCALLLTRAAALCAVKGRWFDTGFYGRRRCGSFEEKLSYSGSRIRGSKKAMYEMHGSNKAAVFIGRSWLVAFPRDLVVGVALRRGIERWGWANVA